MSSHCMGTKKKKTEEEGDWGEERNQEILTENKEKERL